MTALRKAETDLAKCEKVIADGLRTFVEVGRALARIREEDLYKASHKTFEAYCKERWDLSRQRAYELVAASAVSENVRHAGQKVEPNARQATELAKLPEKEQPKAWAEAVKTAPDGVVTAKHVASVVAARMPPPKPVVHECPRHGCMFDDGSECPVCQSRREKGLDVPAKSEPRPVSVPTPAPGKWECPDCGTYWPESVEICRQCSPIEESGGPAEEPEEIGPDPEAFDPDDKLFGLGVFIGECLRSWQGNSEPLAVELEMWARRARAKFEEEKIDV